MALLELGKIKLVLAILLAISDQAYSRPAAGLPQACCVAGLPQAGLGLKPACCTPQTDLLQAGHGRPVLGLLPTTTSTATSLSQACCRLVCRRPAAGYFFCKGRVSFTYAFSLQTRLFEEQWEAALLSRVETTDRLWAMGWCEENWRY